MHSHCSTLTFDVFLNSLMAQWSLQNGPSAAKSLIKNDGGLGIELGELRPLVVAGGPYCQDLRLITQENLRAW